MREALACVSVALNKGTKRMWPGAGGRLFWQCNKDIREKFCLCIVSYVHWTCQRWWGWVPTDCQLRFIVSSHHQSGSMQEKHQRNFVANLHHQKHGTTNIIRGRFIMHSEGIFHLNHLFWIECRTKVVKLQLVPPSTKSAHSKVADLSHKSSPPRWETMSFLFYVTLLCLWSLHLLGADFWSKARHCLLYVGVWSVWKSCSCRCPWVISSLCHALHHLPLCSAMIIKAMKSRF